MKLKDLVFELASVIFNLAALYSQLADNEDRSHMDGIKRAVSYNQVCFDSSTALLSMNPILVASGRNPVPFTDCSFTKVHTTF